MSVVTIAPARMTPPAGLTPRPARLANLTKLHQLIRYYADQDILLPVSPADLRKNIKNFYIISNETRVFACGALHYYTSAAAEVRSLAVAPEYCGSGLGRNIVEALIKQARRRGLEMVFAFTYAVPFFARLGFVPIDRDLVPWKAWSDCVTCPKQQCCDETAVARWLRGAGPQRPGAPWPSHKM